jgi:hypothetical protein
MVKAFLATKTTKENGETLSHVHIPKYNIAILHGMKEAKEELPITYYTEMEQFLASFKKATVKAKKDGMLDEHEAGPFPTHCTVSFYSGPWVPRTSWYGCIPFYNGIAW